MIKKDPKRDHNFNNHSYAQGCVKTRAVSKALPKHETSAGAA